MRLPNSKAMWFAAGFIVSGVAAVLVHNFLFELRYIWNLSVVHRSQSLDRRIRCVTTRSAWNPNSTI